jgi:hypothetical protein
MSEPSTSPIGLRVVPVEDVVALVPDLVRLDARVPADFDVLICALGFEQRCVGIAASLAETGCSSATAIMLTYATNAEDNRRRQSELEGYLVSLGAAVSELEVDDPGFNRRLREALGAVAKPDDRPLRVALDISVASSQAVMRVVHELLRADCDLEVLYAEAESYFPLRAEYENDPEAWSDEDRLNLERGVLTVEFSSEYPGDHDAQLPHVVVLFPGFSRDRTRRILAKVDAEFIIDFDHAPVIWMLGVPPREASKWRRDAVREVQGIPMGHDQHEVSTFDPRETLLVLEGVYARCGLDRNLTLSPMGSKMQALGAALFCYARPDIRVAFARPAEYNASRYSIGIGPLWSLSLGDTLALRRALRRVGTVELLFGENTR